MPGASWVRRPHSSVHPLHVPQRHLTAARFAPDGETVIYSAAWGGGAYALYMTGVGFPSRER